MLEAIVLGSALAVPANSESAHAENESQNELKYSKETHQSAPSSEYRTSHLEFKFQKELPQIYKHAKRIGIEPEFLMAVRILENGKDEIAYGILPQGKSLERYKKDKGYIINNEFYPYTDEKEKQLCWAGHTIKRNLERFQKNSERHKDFISYLADKYAPFNVKNDPQELNKNWEKNFRHFYEKFKN